MAKVHESVLVGYFCQAVGWIVRDLDEVKNCNGERDPTTTRDQRILRAINLSHNPLDPAIGDVILQLDDADGFPKEFYVFEFKVNWNKGVQEEHEKFKKKNNNQPLTPEFIELLTHKFPEAKRAHLFGALAKTSNNRTTLAVRPYWDAMLEKQVQLQSALSKLTEIAYNKAGKGMSLDRLLTYMQILNKDAKEGSMASSGSVRFAVAYQDYQLYSFNLDSVLEHQLEKRRQRDLEREREREHGRGSSLGR